MDGEWSVNGVFSFSRGVVNGATKSFPSTMIRDVLFWPQESNGGMTGDKGGFELHQPKTMIY